MVNIYPDENLEEQIKEESNKQDRSMNNFILHILKKYFRDKEQNESAN